LRAAVASLGRRKQNGKGEFSKEEKKAGGGRKG